MTKIGIVLVALCALAGCKKSGGDCAGTINGFMDRVMGAEMKAAGDKATPEMKKMADDMMKQMSTTMIKVCTDDKWSAEALKCMDDAKDEASAKKCDGTLTPEQKKHLDDAMAEAMGMGMGKHKAKDESAPPAVEAPAGSGN